MGFKARVGSSTALVVREYLRGVLYNMVEWMLSSVFVGKVMSSKDKPISPCIIFTTVVIIVR